MRVMLLYSSLIDYVTMNER